MKIYRDHSGALLGSQPWAQSSPVQIMLSRSEGIRTLNLRVKGVLTIVDANTGEFKYESGYKELIKRVQVEANGHQLIAPSSGDSMVFLDSIHEGRSKYDIMPAGGASANTDAYEYDFVMPLRIARDNSELFDSGILQTFNVIINCGLASDVVDVIDSAATYTFVGNIAMYADASVVEFSDEDRKLAGLCAYYFDSKSGVNGNEKFYGPADRDVECLLIKLRKTDGTKELTDDDAGNISIKIGSDSLIDPMELGNIRHISKEAYAWETLTEGCYMVPLAQPFGSLSKDISTAGRQLEIDITTTQNVDIEVLYASRIAPIAVDA